MSIGGLCLLLLLSIVLVVANGKSLLRLSSSTATNDFFESGEAQDLTNRCQEMLQSGREEVEDASVQILQATGSSCRDLALLARKYLGRFKKQNIKEVPDSPSDRVFAFGFLTKADGTPATYVSNANLVSVSGTRLKEVAGFCPTVVWRDATYKSTRMNINPGRKYVPRHRTCAEHKIINGDAVAELGAGDWLFLYSEFIPCRACQEEINEFAKANNIFVMWGVPEE
eukprot:GILJ01002342.1.p1 GENE.GILJ01002342.1~~GILJ01002342.1.p1  ORF type:complete len:245 (+),score=30.21 GILJ01002342.1:55-735(+)